MSLLRNLGHTGLVMLILSSNAFSAIIHFDDRNAGDIVTTIGDVTFSSNTGFDLIVSDQFDTTSGDNSLGVDGPPLLQNLFIGGDSVTLTFATPVISLSAAFIASPDAPGSVFLIETAVGSATAGAHFDFMLPDGGEVFLVMFSSVTGFTSADLVSLDLETYTFNIDDIEYAPIPIPPALLLFASAAGLLGGMRRRRANP